jgi:hypothetical protein
MELKLVYSLLSAHFLFLILTCVYRIRIHFCPQHWLLYHLVLNSFEFNFKVGSNSRWKQQLSSMYDGTFLGVHSSFYKTSSYRLSSKSILILRLRRRLCCQRPWLSQWHRDQWKNTSEQHEVGVWHSTRHDHLCRALSLNLDTKIAQLPQFTSQQQLRSQGRGQCPDTQHFFVLDAAL